MIERRLDQQRAYEEESARLQWEQQQIQTQIEREGADERLLVMAKENKERIKLLNTSNAKQRSIALDLADGILEGLGKQLMAQGIADISKGVSRGLGSYGGDATTYGLIAWGGAELASGAAMRAGSLMIPEASQQFLLWLCERDFMAAFSWL